jgi:Uma2 family endonuclease
VRSDLANGQHIQPDLFVIRLRDGREPLEWAQFGIPRLVAEVLSPSTAFNDRDKQRRTLQRYRIDEYWIADPDARLLERWRPDDERPEILTATLSWQPEPAIPPLEIDVAELFAEIWAEG